MSRAGVFVCSFFDSLVVPGLWIAAGTRSACGSVAAYLRSSVVNFDFPESFFDLMVYVIV